MKPQTIIHDDPGAPMPPPRLEEYYQSSFFCPGCDGRRGQGPGGCCKKCWKDRPKRKPPEAEDDETQ